jgi:hypothetical protein
LAKRHQMAFKPKLTIFKGFKKNKKPRLKNEVSGENQKPDTSGGSSGPSGDF